MRHRAHVGGPPRPQSQGSLYPAADRHVRPASGRRPPGNVTSRRAGGGGLRRIVVGRGAAAEAGRGATGGEEDLVCGGAELVAAEFVEAAEGPLQLRAVLLGVVDERARGEAAAAAAHSAAAVSGPVCLSFSWESDVGGGEDEEEQERERGKRSVIFLSFCFVLLSFPPPFR